MGVVVCVSWFISSWKCSIPGLGRPMALRMPCGSSMRVGLGYPWFGVSPMDLVVIAPAPALMIRCMLSASSSMMPAASIMGLFNVIPAMVVCSEVMIVHHLVGLFKGVYLFGVFCCFLLFFL